MLYSPHSAVCTVMHSTRAVKVRTNIVRCLRQTDVGSFGFGFNKESTRKWRTQNDVLPDAWVHHYVIAVWNVHFHVRHTLLVRHIAKLFLFCVFHISTLSRTSLVILLFFTSVSYDYVFSQKLHYPLPAWCKRLS